MTEERARAAETKQQMERDYNSKSDDFLSLSAEFLALKVSLEVHPRCICHSINHLNNNSVNTAITIHTFAKAHQLISKDLKKILNITGKENGANRAVHISRAADGSGAGDIFGVRV